MLQAALFAWAGVHGLAALWLQGAIGGAGVGAALEPVARPLLASVCRMIAAP